MLLVSKAFWGYLSVDMGGKSAGESMKKTYASVLAGSNVVGQAVDVVWVAHEDGRLDSGEGSAGEG